MSVWYSAVIGLTLLWLLTAFLLDGHYMRVDWTRTALLMGTFHTLLFASGFYGGAS